MREFEGSFRPQPEPSGRGVPPRPPKKTARGLMDGPEWRGSILDEIENRLARYPEARVKRDLSSISYLPSYSDGYVVTLRVARKRGVECYSVFYKNSHVETTARKAAVVEFGFALSNGCRLKEYLKRGEAYRSTVEIWDIEERRWKPDWEFIPWSNALWKFWDRPTIRYLQNRLIDLDSDDLRAAA
jgi:hypothetical protein